MISQKKAITVAKQFAILVLLAVPIGWAMCGDCLDSWEWAVISGLVSIGIWSVMWLGNGLLVDFISAKISWLEQPVKRFVVGVLAMIVYTVAAMTLVDFIIHVTFGGSPESWFSLREFFLNGGIALLITTIIASFLHARTFYIHWRTEVLNVEKYKSESINSKYEALKNQVNPHFLFNSLNVLTTLVYQDQDMAAKFIKKLSNVYRYVLETKDAEMVDLEKELQFVDDFVFLQQIRFGQSLKFSSHDIQSGIKVPPLSLQLLIENAIKHNEISEQTPLYIDLKQVNDYLEVSNNLQPKAIMDEEKGNIGLTNLKQRYEYLTDRVVEIINDSKNFTVRIPAIIP